jgi:hypothetical protein
MDFGIENLTVNKGVVSVPLSELSDTQLEATRAELDTVGVERGLWVPAGAGSLVVATTVETSNFHNQLLKTAEEGSKLYIATIAGINEGRAKKKRIPTLAVGEYVERAAGWLTASREQAAVQLPATDRRPQLIIPRLNHAVTTEEIVDAWSAASDHGLYSWTGRMKFLKNWTADQLSGFDPSIEGETTFEVVPATYDQAREGTVATQVANLEELQVDYPEIGVATLFNGIPLARRYKGQTRVWNDSYVRPIDFTPSRVGGRDCVPGACVSDVGEARVGDSSVQYDGAARLLVR